MANTHKTLTALFSAIADAIRAKTGSTAKIVADDFPSAIAAIGTSGGGNGNVASGSTTVAADCSSFAINPALGTIDTIVVIRTAEVTGKSGTWCWVKNGSVGSTCYTSYSTIALRYSVYASNLTINGDGSVTVNQYGASYPIPAGTYNWVAYGSK